MRARLQNINEGVVPSMQDFLNKCNIITDKLVFIVGAVEAIAEVCSFPTKFPSLTDITAF